MAVGHSLSKFGVVLMYIDDIICLSGSSWHANTFIREVFPWVESVELPNNRDKVITDGAGPGSEVPNLLWWRKGALTVNAADCLRL